MSEEQVAIEPVAPTQVQVEDAFFRSLLAITSDAARHMSVGDVVGYLADTIAAILAELPPRQRKDMMTPIRWRILNSARECAFVKNTKDQNPHDLTENQAPT